MPIGDFNDVGVKINNDLDNRAEGPHYDIIKDLRNDIGGVDKLRITPDGDVMNGETQIGPVKLPWGE